MKNFKIFNKLLKIMDNNVKKNQYNTTKLIDHKIISTYIIYGIILLVIILVIIIVSLYTASVLKQTNINVFSTIPIQPSNSLVLTEVSEYIKKINATGIDQNQSTCVGNNLIYSDNKCTCAFPYFGEYCSREFHESNYYDLAIDPLLVKFTSNKLINVNDLSFSENGQTTNSMKLNTYIESNPQSCTGLCNNTDGCIGVIFDNKGCQLITSKIEVPDNVKINNPLESISTMFIKGGVNVILNNKIILYTGKKPIRYWNPSPEFIPLPTTNNRGFIQFKANNPNKLNWIPKRIMNFSNLIGIWSIIPLNNIPSIVSTDTVYIDKGNVEFIDYELDFPNFIKNAETIYVIYVTQDKVPEIKKQYKLPPII